ncbi:carboxymuconolactone decarboxylase family protein [Acuticoccus sp.]|uniref:carboxymuconolactone decarboxylase family protein n=1 Tax=Acuticoccus sp. TaxID=1904378 RepID=UPI003B515BF3
MGDHGMSDAKAQLAVVKGRIGELTKALPETARSFQGLTKAAKTDGALSGAQKELVAVTIAVSKGCEGCILYHIEAAKKLGAKRDELLEMMSVAVEMGGGPAMVYASQALDAFDAMEA